MLTKKHFQTAAKIIADTEDGATRERLALAFARFFRAENPRFDEARFFQACGLSTFYGAE